MVKDGSTDVTAIDRSEWRSGLGEFGDFRRDLQVNEASVEHRRRELQSDAEFFLGQGDRGKTQLIGRRCRDENLAAGEETALLSANGDDCRLRENFDEAVLLGCIEGQAVAVRLDGAAYTRAIG